MRLYSVCTNPEIALLRRHIAQQLYTKLRVSLIQAHSQL